MDDLDPVQNTAAQQNRTSISPYASLVFWLKSCRLRAMQNIPKGKVAIQHLKII